MKSYHTSQKLVLFILCLILVSTRLLFPQQPDISEFQYISPEPGSSMNSPFSNIIIRYGPVYNAGDIYDDKLLQVTGDNSGLHSGGTKLAEDNKTLLFIPDLPFTEGENVSVKITKSVRTDNDEIIPTLDFKFRITEKDLNKSKRDEPHTILSGILEPEIQFNNEINFRSSSNEILNNSLPEDFPEITLDVNNNPAPGEIFLTPFIYPGFRGTYLIILDNYGVPVFYRKSDMINYDFKMQPTGVLSYFENGLFYIMDSSYTIIDSVYMKNGYPTDLHEFLLLPNGHTLMMSYDVQTVAMDTIVPGGIPDATVTGLVIQELDENKDVVFQWRSWDHFQITDATYDIDLTDSLIDYVHGNAIEVDYDGNLLISSRHLDEITKISRQTGNIIWRLGGEHCNNNQFTFINDPIGFSHQHDIRRLPNGNITLFDNGNLHDPIFSRSVEYQLDQVNMYAQLIADYRNIPQSLSWAMGSSRRLENHNTIIGWGTGTLPAITEVAIDGSVTLSFSLPDTMLNYRAFKYQWKTNLFTSNPESLFFGYVPFGDSLELSIEVINNSDQQIEINDTYNRLLVYQVTSSLPIVIPPFESQDITVKFKPQNEGDYFDELHLRWETEGQRIAQLVPLIGSGDPNFTFVDLDNVLSDFYLSQNYPNPFNPSTKIRYEIPERSFITIKVYDVLGNEVASLVNEEKLAGKYELEFSVGRDSSPDIASGIYFYRLQSGSFVETKKMLLLK